MIAQATQTGSEQIVLALIAVIAASVGALVFVIRNGKVVRDTNEQITQVNAAVNNIGPGEHRLYDKVSHVISELEDVKDILADVTLEIKQHKLFWDQLHRLHIREPTPAEAALVTTLKEIKEEVSKVQEKLEKLPSSER